MKTFDFSLSESVKFHDQGKADAESTCLTFYAPSVKNRKHVAKLKQGFMRAGASLDGETSEEEKKKASEARGDDAIKPSEVLAILQMSETDYEGYIETFVNLITSGVCKIDDAIPMTKSILDGMSCEDLEKAMGEYLVNFILGSLEE
jgi:hypothetical protein